MATKSKKWRNNFCKTLAVLLIAACAAAGLGLVVYYTPLQRVSYVESEEYLTLMDGGVRQAAAALESRTSAVEPGAEVFFRVTDSAGKQYTNGGSDLADIGVYDLENDLHNNGNHYYLWEDGIWTFSDTYWGTKLEPLQERLSGSVNTRLAGKAENLLLYVPNDIYARNSNAYYTLQDQEFVRKAIYPSAALIAGIALAALYLMVVAGRRPLDEELHLSVCDRWPTEIVLGLGFADLAAMGWSLLLLGQCISSDNYQALSPVCVLLLVLLGILGLALLLCLVRKAKAHLFWNGSLCQRVLHFAAGLGYLPRLPLARRGAARILWVGGAAIAGTLIFGTLIPGLLGIRYTSGRALFVLLFGFAFTIAGAVYLYNEQRRDGLALDALLTQLEQTANGADAPVTVPQGSGLFPYAQSLAQLDQRMKSNLEARLKSERMKIDLVTNVSHDLKTPLTSIIGYVDLLAKQEDLPAEARDYVLILQQKSEGLKDLVSDLFALAKSTSGAEPVELETLDLSMALRQTLADMADLFEKGGIPVREALPDTAPVLAESAKLNRVLQNLLDNAERYSLPGTRIYVSIQPGPDSTLLTVKNTASYEMTFTQEEILQRFARGDAARTTDGSGLGLSIAESFMHNFGGALDVRIEGDTFTVTLTFQTGTPDAAFCLDDEQTPMEDAPDTL